VFDLVFRLVYSWNLFSAVLAGFAISCSFVIQACFVVARGVFDEWYYSEAIGATLWLPIVNVLMSWLIDEAVDLLADTVSASAWEGIWGLPGGSTTVHNRRAQFVYLTIGNGTRPAMLRFRALFAAVLAALLVPTQKAPVFGTNSLNLGDEDMEATTASKDTQKKKQKKKMTTKTKKQVEPLFRIPTAIALAVDIIFILGLFVFPIAYMLWSRFGVYRYSSFLSSISTILFLIGLTMPCIYAVLHLVVFCWPRAACLFAFACGEDVAEVISAPYTLPLLNRAIVAEPVSCGCCCRCCVGCIERDEEDAWGMASNEWNGTGRMDWDSSNDTMEAARPPFRRLHASAQTLREWDLARVDVCGIHPEHVRRLAETTKGKLDPGPQDVGVFVHVGHLCGHAFHLCWHRFVTKCYKHRHNTKNHVGWNDKIKHHVSRVVHTHVLSRHSVVRRCARHPKHFVYNWVTFMCRCGMRRESPGGRQTFCLIRLALILVFIALAFLSHVLFHTLPGVVAFQLSSGAISLMLGLTLYFFAHPLIGRSFVAVIVVQQIFLMGLSSQMPKLMNVPLHVGDPAQNGTIDTSHAGATYTQIVRRPNGTTLSNTTTSWPAPAFDHFPVCSLAFDPRRLMSPIDAAALAVLVYNDDGGKAEATAAWRGGPLADVVQTRFVQQAELLNATTRGKTRAGGTKSRLRWASWKFADAKIVAYSLAGTTTILDALIDASYYSLQSTLRLSGFLVPFHVVLPVEVMQTLIEILTARNAFLPSEFLDVLDDVKASQAAHTREDGWSHVIVGHSLGGAYANVIAARAGALSFALSPPGLYFGTKKMGLHSLRDLTSYLVSVIPEFDLVPEADGQFGTIAHVPCTVSDTLNGVSKAIECHGSARTLSMLVLGCGDRQYPRRQWEIVAYPNSAEKRKVYLQAGDSAGKGGAAGFGGSVVPPKGWAGS
jgi:hypothetical protein